MLGLGTLGEGWTLDFEQQRLYLSGQVPRGVPGGVPGGVPDGTPKSAPKGQ
jgi:hypothetical protein